MSYLTTQLIHRIAQRLLMRAEHPEDASRHFNLSTLEYISLVDSEEFTPAVDAARTEFTEYIAESLGVQIDGDTPAERYKLAKKLSKDLSKISRYPAGWDV